MKLNSKNQNIIFILLSVFYLCMLSNVQAASPARITSPANGSTFTSTTVTFDWENVGAAQYYLYIGTTQGANNLYSGSQDGNTSKTISGLPGSGGILHVRIWSQINGNWLFNDYTYTSYTEVVSNEPAKITNPVDDSIFTSTTITFDWENVGAAQYYLDIGSSQGTNNLYSASQGTNTSKTINELPNNGSTVYVRIWSRINGNWLFNDYTYTAYTEAVSNEPAKITNPVNGSTFTATAVTFDWENVGATQYYLYIGTIRGSSNLYSGSQGTNTSKTVNGLPSNGSTVYVRIWSQIDHSWLFNDYAYSTYTEVVSNEPAKITNPANGSTFTSTTVTFEWENVGAAQYYLYIGTSEGDNNLYANSQGTNTSKSISGLPSDGSTVYVRIWSKIDGNWLFNDFIYTAYTEAISTEPARITSPENASTLTSTSVTFEWENVGAFAHYLYIGTSQGANNLYSASQGTNTSKTISGLPNNGSTLYVRIWSRVNRTWLFNDHIYIAFSYTGCTLGTDSDNDRLDDCYETNTGNYISSTDTGTDPGNADTDGDAISDGDEVLGTLSGLNLPAMGANPLRQDIFLEYDWFDDSLECGSHSHRPTASALNQVTAAFSSAPRSNPDGTTGITFHHDYGQGGMFTGGNLINDTNGVLSGGVDDSEFAAHKAANFDENRQGYFHYVILPHRYNNNSNSSGQAELPGNDLIVSLYCAGSDDNVAHTIMHELGHNLDIRHGGDSNCNHKPNYNSVMNYRYQFPGVDNNCTPPGDGVLDYSRGTYISLNENSLNENNGICGSPGWDWNSNGGTFQSSLILNINSDDEFESSNCGGTLTVLNDHNDWANISFSGLGNADGASVTGIQEVISCDNPAPMGN